MITIKFVIMINNDNEITVYDKIDNVRGNDFVK